jgi:hypothetical protein
MDITENKRWPHASKSTTTNHITSGSEKEESRDDISWT